MLIVSRRSVRLGLLAAITAICALLVAPAADSRSRWGKDYLPNVKLLTDEGKSVRFYDDVLRNKTVVISFIFTNCRDICPLITARLAQVYERLGDAAGRDIHFVSITIDPVNDTPAKLKTHAEAFRSDKRWMFLTGDVANINLVRHKLGERSRLLTDHAAQVMIYNDRTGAWGRDSAFADMESLAMTIRAMDPDWRAPQVSTAAMTGHAHAPELPGQALYAKACASCHTIGDGNRVGPDLKDLTQRRPRDWLQAFIREPAKMLKTKDPTAMLLAEQFPSVRMPTLQLEEADISDLLSYIDARSFVVDAARADAKTAHAAGGGQGAGGQGSGGQGDHSAHGPHSAAKPKTAKGHAPHH